MRNLGTTALGTAALLALAAVVGCGSSPMMGNTPAVSPGPPIPDTPGVNTALWRIAPTGVHCPEFPGATVQGIAVAPGGEIFLAGTYTGPADLGAGALPASTEESTFVAKFQANGTPLWSRGFPGNGASVAVGADGTAVLASAAYQNFMSGGTVTVTHVAADGTPDWQKEVTWGPEKFGFTVVAIASSGDGYVLAAPGTLTRFQADGTPDWTRIVDYQSPSRLLTAADGDIVLSGIEEVTWAPLVEHQFLGRFDAAGQLRWRRSFLGPDNDNVAAGLDPSGAALVVGFLVGDVTFQDGPSLQGLPTSEGPLANFLLKVDPAAHATWALTSDTEAGSFDDVTGDGSGRAVIAGEAAGGARVAVFSPDGKPVWDLTYDVRQQEGGLSARIARQGSRLLVAGSHDLSMCADCNICYQPRPFMIRVNADGQRDSRFGQLLP